MMGIGLYRIIKSGCRVCKLHVRGLGRKKGWLVFADTLCRISCICCKWSSKTQIKNDTTVFLEKEKSALIRLHVLVEAVTERA